MYYEVDATVGEEIVIEQSENASTGYTNTLVSHRGLEFLRKESVNLRPRTPGSSNLTYYHFLASEEGHYLIHFLSCRPWECEKTREDTIFVVKVHESSSM